MSGLRNVSIVNISYIAVTVIRIFICISFTFWLPRYSFTLWGPVYISPSCFVFRSQDVPRWSPQAAWPPLPSLWRHPLVSKWLAKSFLFIWSSLSAGQFWARDFWLLIMCQIFKTLLELAGMGKSCHWSLHQRAKRKKGSSPPSPLPYFWDVLVLFSLFTWGNNDLVYSRILQS